MFKLNSTVLTYQGMECFENASPLNVMNRTILPAKLRSVKETTTGKTYEEKTE
jgi:hypothetical protein